MMPIEQPQDETALVSQAKADETQALSEYLQGRVLSLNVEVRRRDARIAQLEAELATHQADVSDTSEGPDPQ